MDKYRAFLGVVYPDSTSYDCKEKLECLDGVFEKWAYILHDKDVDEETGELKKAHYHWVGYRKNAVEVKTIARQLGLKLNDVEYAKKGWRAIVRYLIHIDNPEKAPYAESDIAANFKFMPLLQRQMESDEVANEIAQFIVQGRVYKTSVLTHWCLENGYWSELRRGFALWSSLMREFVPVQEENAKE